MSNSIFDFSSDGPEHPTARAWLSRIHRGERATFTIWRKRDGLIFKPATIYMTFQTPSGEVREHEGWDVDINEALVREHVVAESASNEAQRLSLMLRYWFSKPEERYGPGFFEAVLFEFARDSEIANQDPLGEILERIHVTPADSSGASFAACKDEIEAILRDKAARALVRDLRYPEDQAKQILAAALAQYLDERFHLTERKLLGWS